MSEAGTWDNVAVAPPPPPPRRQPTRTRRTSDPSRAVKSPRPSRAPSRATGAPPELDLTEKINGALQSWIAAPLLTAGIITRKRALLADASVIADDGPKLAAEVNELAKEDPRVAQLIEKITKAVPYSAILQIVITMAAKIATNHRPQLLPLTSKIFGAKPLDETVGTQEELDEQLRMLATVAATSPNGRPPDANDQR